MEEWSMEIYYERLPPALTFHISACYGGLAMIQHHVQVYRVNVESATSQGVTALHMASQKGHLDVVRYLIEQGGANATATTNHPDGWNALHYASNRGHLPVVQYLVDNGHYANIEAATDYRGMNALHHASHGGRLDVVQYLIEQVHVSVESRDNYGLNALLHASHNGHLAVVQYLTEQVPQVNVEATTRGGWNAWHYAFRHEQTHVMQYLAEHGLAHTEATDRMQALHYAGNNGRIKVVFSMVQRIPY
jgi:ankyrin repeat protein